MITNRYIKKIADAHGMDLCGVASIDSFEKAPTGFHPHDIFSECKSVIAIAKVVPEGPLKYKSNIPYTVANDIILNKVISASILMSTEIEQRKKAACIPVPSEPYDYWDAENLVGKGLLSLKHAGYLAGLGSIGKNSLLTNKKFGNRITLGAILVDEEIKPDKIETVNPCPEACELCEVNCPVSAIADCSVNQKLCRNNSMVTNKKGYAYYSCSECRVVCPNGEGV